MFDSGRSDASLSTNQLFDTVKTTMDFGVGALLMLSKAFGLLAEGMPLPQIDYRWLWQPVLGLVWMSFKRSQDETNQLLVGIMAQSYFRCNFVGPIGPRVHKAQGASQATALDF